MYNNTDLEKLAYNYHIFNYLSIINISKIKL